MEENTTLSVTYRNQELEIPIRMMMQGYSYKIETLINDTAVWFEPDEERNFRAVLPYDTDAGLVTLPDGALLQAVADALEAALK